MTALKILITIVLYLAVSFFLASRLGKFLHDVDKSASDIIDRLNAKHEEEEGNTGMPGAGAATAA